MTSYYVFPGNKYRTKRTGRHGLCRKSIDHSTETKRENNDDLCARFSSTCGCWCGSSHIRMHARRELDALTLCTLMLTDFESPTGGSHMSATQSQRKSGYITSEDLVPARRGSARLYYTCEDNCLDNRVSPYLMSHALSSGHAPIARSSRILAKLGLYTRGKRQRFLVHHLNSGATGGSNVYFNACM